MACCFTIWQSRWLPTTVHLSLIITVLVIPIRVSYAFLGYARNNSDAMSVRISPRTAAKIRKSLETNKKEWKSLEDKRKISIFATWKEKPSRATMCGTVASAWWWAIRPCRLVSFTLDTELVTCGQLFSYLDISLPVEFFLVCSTGDGNEVDELHDLTAHLHLIVRVDIFTANALKSLKTRFWVWSEQSRSLVGLNV